MVKNVVTYIQQHFIIIQKCVVRNAWVAQSVEDPIVGSGQDLMGWGIQSHVELCAQREPT